MARLRAAFLVLALAAAAPASANPIDRWASFIGEASARFGIPDSWIRRVMNAESGGQTRLGGRLIKSHAGAMGLMQIMPGTWRELRVAHGLGPDPHEPRDNIIAGTAYLRKMYDRFGYPGLFAAYNAGQARYAEHLATGRRLPDETVAYVAKVAGARATPIAPVRPTAPAPALFVEISRPSADGGQPQKGSAASSASALFVRLGASLGSAERPDTWRRGGREGSGE